MSAAVADDHGRDTGADCSCGGMLTEYRGQIHCSVPCATATEITQRYARLLASGDASATGAPHLSVVPPPVIEPRRVIEPSVLLEGNGYKNKYGYVTPEESRTLHRMEALGVSAQIHERFACILPGHDHDARVHWDGRGFFRYGCAAGDWGLADVRAHLAYGDCHWISQVEAARWRERLDHEAGLQELRPVPLTVGDELPASARRVGRGLVLYLGLRDERWGTQPFEFARRFCMAYCGADGEPLPARAAQCGMERLEHDGLIVRAGLRGRVLQWTLPAWKGASTDGGGDDA